MNGACGPTIGSDSKFSGSRPGQDVLLRRQGVQPPVEADVQPRQAARVGAAQEEADAPAPHVR